MPRVRITPNTTMHPGHVGSLVSLVAPGPMLTNGDGTVVVKMSDDQLENFKRRGGSAHKVEILPDAPDPFVVTDEPAGPVGDVSLIPVVEIREKTTTDVAGYLATCRGRGMSDQEIIDALVRNGWRESQAIDVVMNDIPPAA